MENVLNNERRCLEKSTIETYTGQNLITGIGIYFINCKVVSS
jgi:hypothetical protein